MNIQTLTPNKIISHTERQEAINRLQFFPGNRYKYTPSDRYMTKYGEYLLKRKVENLKEKFKH